MREGLSFNLNKIYFAHKNGFFSFFFNHFAIVILISIKSIKEYLIRNHTKKKYRQN